MTIAEEKQAQRTAARAARKALDAPQRAAAKVKSNGFQPVRTYRVTVQNLEDGAETDLRVLARSVAVATEAARIVPANRTAPRQSDHRILSTRKNPVPVFDISVVLVQQPVPFVCQLFTASVGGCGNG